MGAVPPEDAVTDVAVAGDHHEVDVPAVSAWLSAGGRVAVTADCSACLLDVELYRWRGAGGRSSAPEPTRRELTNDVADSATLDVPAALVGHAAALDVRITVVDHRERAREVSRVLFVRVEPDGQGVKLTPTTWADFACTEGFARCEPDGRGGTQLVMLPTGGAR